VDLELKYISWLIHVLVNCIVESRMTVMDNEIRDCILDKLNEERNKKCKEKS
jgi:hypothetical protein